MPRLLLIGTTNPARVAMLRDVFQPLAVHVAPALAAGQQAPDIEEDGPTAAHNARLKSLAFAAVANQPVLSIDNALYMDGLPPAEQPGINTRSVPGVPGRATDEQLLDHYISVIERLGGLVDGHWDFAVCLAVPAHGRQPHIFETLIRSPRRFVAVPSPCRMPGYPLESIQVDPQSGRYITEMDAAERAGFWRRILGPSLHSFLAPHLSLLPER